MRHSFVVLTGLIAGVSSVAFTALTPMAARSEQLAQTEPATINFISTGFRLNSFRVKVNAPQVQFATPGCENQVFNDGYVADSTQPAFRIHFDTLLMAKETGKKVSLVLSDKCLFGRPQIISVVVF